MSFGGLKAIVRLITIVRHLSAAAQLSTFPFVS